MITVYISIGNSDDKLCQVDWAMYLGEVHQLLDPYWPNPEDSLTSERHGSWFSDPLAPWQNACWCVELDEDLRDKVQAELADIASRYQQDSIAWAEAQTTFIEAAK